MEQTPHLPPDWPLVEQRRAIIVGASSGIGAALTKRLAAAGYTVAAVARREANLVDLCDEINRPGERPRACYYTHDVTRFNETPALFQRITRDLNGLDLIVYAAGIMPTVAADAYDFKQDARIMGVNTLGAIAWLDEAATRFHRARSGHIVGVSSIAGERGRVGFPAYSTSKAALSTYLEALRNRLSRRGVTVTTIKPGMVETEMLADVDRKMWPVSAEDAAEQIYRAIADRKQTVYVPARWRWVALALVHIPSVIFRRLNF